MESFYLMEKCTVVLCGVAGDNLGSHSTGGFTENFSKSRFFCRFCTVGRSTFLPSPLTKGGKKGWLIHTRIVCNTFWGALTHLELSLTQSSMNYSTFMCAILDCHLVWAMTFWKRLSHLTLRYVFVTFLQSSNCSLFHILIAVWITLTTFP